MIAKVPALPTHNTSIRRAPAMASSTVTAPTTVSRTSTAATNTCTTVGTSSKSNAIAAVVVRAHAACHVPAARQLVDPGAVEACFQPDLTSRRIDREPRRGDGARRVVAVDEEAREHLEMDRRLHMTAHRAEDVGRA